MIAPVMDTRIVEVAPEATVQEAIGLMVDKGIGSVAVCEGTRLVGIFTERDVLRLASERRDFQDVRVGEVMTKHLIIASPEMGILDAAWLMGEHQIRHLPVVEGENLLGMVGIRDVLRTLFQQVWGERNPDARETASRLLARK